MKITKKDLLDAHSTTNAILNNLTHEAQILESQAKRIRDMRHLLFYYIKEGNITNTELINCAISWIYHSNKTPEEIINMILELGA